MDITPQNLRDLAAETFEQFRMKINFVPAQDLPLCAKVLLDLAERLEGKAQPETAEEKPQTGKGKAQ